MFVLLGQADTHILFYIIFSVVKLSTSGSGSAMYT
jgi:hypothetical protein